ncbi:hypothetical protein LguiA_015479 [Lonicera macranthoides]
MGTREGIAFGEFDRFKRAAGGGAEVGGGEVGVGGGAGWGLAGDGGGGCGGEIEGKGVGFAFAEDALEGGTGEPYEV